MNWDNKKEFKKNVGKWGKYEIYNSGFMGFGTGDKLLDIELEENSEYCGKDCYAEKEFILYKEGSLVDDVRFLGGNVISYNFYIMDGKNKIPYELGKKVPAGKYRLRLEGSKDPSKSVDWQIKSQGIWTEEWIYWNSWQDWNDDFEDGSINSTFWETDVATCQFGGSAGGLTATITEENDTDGYIKEFTQILASAGEQEYAWSALRGKQDFNDSLDYNISLTLDGYLAPANSGKEGVIRLIINNGVIPTPPGGNCDGSFPVNGDLLHLFTNSSLATKTNYVIVVNSTSKNVSLYNSTHFINSTLATSAIWNFYIDTITQDGYDGIGAVKSSRLNLYNYTVIGDTVLAIFNFPIEDFGTSESILNLSCNFTALNTENISDVSVNVYNSTGIRIFNDTDNSVNNQSFSKIWTTPSLDDGNYTWSCEVNGNKGSFNSTSNRTFIIDATAPSLNISFPTGTITYHLANTNLSLNWTVSDINLDSCWYNYNGTNITVACLDNSTSFNVIDGINKNLTFYANDTSGNINTSFTSWDYKLFEHNQTYNSETTEGSLETFLAYVQLGSGYSIEEVDLEYNLTNYSGQSFTIGIYDILRKEDLLIPNVGADINLSFYWRITLSDSTSINLSSQNQTVYNLALDNCTSYTNELLNFTVVDEEKQTILPNATIEIAVNLYDRDRTIDILNFSNQFEKINPLRICLNRNITNDSSYSLDTVVRYEDIGYANEYYNIVNSTINNETTTQKITLYDLNITDSTDFQLTFTGSDFLPVENALVYIDRQYISENTFKTVELPKTDFNGQSVLHLVRNEVIYNIRIIKEGQVLGNFENMVAFCDDFTIGDCNIELNAFDSVEAVFNSDESLGIIFTAPNYNATSDKITFNFVTEDGAAKTVKLEVTRNDIFGNRSICNSTLISSGGTLTCNIDPNLEESVLITKIYVDEVLAVSGNVKLDTSAYGVGGYLVFFIMAMSFILMFSDSKTGVLVSMILSFVSAVGLGLVTGDIIGIGASGLWLIVMVIIGLVKLNKDRPQ